MYKRQLKRQIDGQFYERTMLSGDKAKMLLQADSDSETDSPESINKDPFVLEFLSLKDDYSESDLEDALIYRLADFLLEMGDDFTFVGRQRRLQRIHPVFFICISSLSRYTPTILATFRNSPVHK